MHEVFPPTCHLSDTSRDDVSDHSCALLNNPRLRARATPSRLCRAQLTCQGRQASQALLARIKGHNPQSIPHAQKQTMEGLRPREMSQAAPAKKPCTCCGQQFWGTRSPADSYLLCSRCSSDTRVWKQAKHCCHWISK